MQAPKASIALALAALAVAPGCGKKPEAASAQAITVKATARAKDIPVSQSGPLLADQQDSDFVRIEYELTGVTGVKIKEWGCWFKNWETDHPSVRVRNYHCNVDSAREVPLAKGRKITDAISVRLVGLPDEPFVNFRICYTPIDAEKMAQEFLPVLGTFCSNPIRLDLRRP